jgi:hypothetical protein
MATHNTHVEVDQEMLASRQAVWAGFVKFSTYAIVSVAVLLLLGAIFLL